MCAATLYLRPSTLPLVAGALVLTLIGVVTMLRGLPRRRGLLTGLAATAVCGALVLPWSVAASVALGGRVVTTTTAPLSLGVAFGNVHKLCFGHCPPGNIWINATRYSRAVAAVSGESETEVQRSMAEYALQEVTPHSYASAVLDDARRYLVEENGFEERFSPDRSAFEGTSRLALLTTSVLYRSAMVLWAVALLVVVRRSFRGQLVSLLVKLFSGALLLQPFVHICSGRYWPTLAPLFAVGIALLLSLLPQRLRGGSWDVALPGADELGARPLIWAQGVAAAVAVLVVLALVVLGA
jgi:hypothetical protein